MAGLSVRLSVCLFVTFVCPARTAQPIEMPFRVLTWVDPRNHVFDGVKFGRIHSLPRGVTRWRCGLSSKFSNHVLLFWKTSATVVDDAADVGCSSTLALDAVTMDLFIRARLVLHRTSMINFRSNFSVSSASLN